MNEKQSQQGGEGPQGTQVFKLDAINQMIAEEIVEGRAPGADTPALVGISANVSGQQYLLKQPKMEVGRRPSSDVCLDDASVSSIHAHLLHQNDEWKVLNLLSSNGTFVNGKKVTEQTLVAGDRVAFGGSEFVFAMVEDLTPEGRKSNHSGLALVGAVLIMAFVAVLYFLM